MEGLVMTGLVLLCLGLAGAVPWLPLIEKWVIILGGYLGVQGGQEWIKSWRVP